jgi:cation transport ATPase
MNYTTCFCWVLCLVGCIAISSCGFQQRKYTHGHFWEHKHEPTTSHPTTAISAMTENDRREDIAIHSDILIISDDVSSMPLVSDQVERSPENADLNLNVVKDTTIKGNKPARVDLPNQKEEPAGLNDHYKEAKKHVRRYSGISTFLFAAMVALYVSMTQSSGIYTESLYSGVVVAGLLMMLALLVFRNKWKNPYQRMSEDLRSYRKFNEKEKWYKAFENKLFSINFLIGMAVVFTIFAFFMVITPLYGGY